MGTSRWDDLRDLFARALELPAHEREAFLAEACADDEMRDEIRSLLGSAAREGPLDALASRLASIRDVLREQVPESVGPYVIAERIGAGGMGVVYRAHDPRLRRDVALKFLPAFLHDHTPGTERLMAEARAASALDHPNICTIHDIASGDDDRVFIAMAYYPGGTLEDRLRDGALPVADALTIARQIADALDCAHGSGIVHRDIKPANIAFGERGEVKVLDFGVAVLADDAIESSGSTAGTPSYMAPEQVAGTPADQRSDLWAMGVVLFEMLTGQKPFSGADRAAVHNAILHDDAISVQALRPALPPDVAAIVRRALVRDPAERYQTAAELRSALIEVGAAVSALPASRHMRRWYAATAAAVLLLVSLAALARQRAADPGGTASDTTAARIAEQIARGRERYYAGSPESNEGAIVIFRSIVEQDSSNAAARAFLAGAYAVATRSDFFRRGEVEWLDSAVTHANAAIALAPQLAHGYSALGVAHRWAGRLDEALEAQRDALARDPFFALAMIETGFIHHALGRPDEAVIWLERGLAVEPRIPAARQYAAALYRTFDMQNEAHRHLMEGRVLAPDDASLAWETVLLALMGGDTAFARTEFDAYIQLVSAGERERMHAWYHILRGDPHTARAHADRLDLTNAPWYDLRAFGAMYVQAGERERGSALLHRALADIDSAAGSTEWGRRSPDFARGYVHAVLGNRERAIAALESWVQDGGMRSWTQLPDEESWKAIADDPRFLDIVRRSEQHLQEKRSHIQQELNRRRD